MPNSSYGNLSTLINSFTLLQDGRRNTPGEETDKLAHLLPHGCCTSPQVILKELTDETLEDQDLSEGWVSGQGAEQCDTVSRDSRGAAIALG